MKKILIFSLAYYPHVGGAEIAIKEITDRIRDIEFHMLTLRFDGEPKRERVGSIEVHRIGLGSTYMSKVLFVPRAALKAWGLHKKERFDGFWAMMAYMTFPITLLRFLGIRSPYVLTLQEGDPFEHVFGRWHIIFLKPLLLLGFRRACVIQTISTFLARWARRMKFTGTIEVIPNAVDTGHFSKTYSSEEIKAAQKDIGKKPEDVYVVTTSRLVKKNAVDDVIRALPHTLSNVKFLVFGTGPDEKMLKKLAQEEGVADRVIFWGHIEHGDMPRYLKACDIFARPSRSEGMGNSFVEAFAAGLPVIATQVGGIADFLFDEKRNPDKEATGWVVDPDSPSQIAEAIKNIIENPKKVEWVTQNARKLAFEKYDWDLIACHMRTKVFARVLREG